MPSDTTNTMLMSSRRTRVNPDRPPPGHSAIEAYAQALEMCAEGGRVSIMVLGMGQMFDMVKLSATTETQSLHVECSARDASLIVAALGASATDDVTDMVAVFEAEGASFDAARELAGDIVALDADCTSTAPRHGT